MIGLWIALAWIGWIPALIVTCWLAGVIVLAVQGAARWCRFQVRLRYRRGLTEMPASHPDRAVTLTAPEEQASAALECLITGRQP